MYSASFFKCKHALVFDDLLFSDGQLLSIFYWRFRVHLGSRSWRRGSLTDRGALVISLDTRWLCWLDDAKVSPWIADSFS